LDRRASDTVSPGGRFVIGGASIGVIPHALVPLDLQNGPDAVRMVWPDGTIEVVGYARSSSRSTRAARPQSTSHRGSHCPHSRHGRRRRQCLRFPAPRRRRRGARTSAVAISRG
jgi:hypothetical protein